MMKSTASQMADEPLGDDLTLGPILADISGELTQAAQSCSALQWSISALLEKVNHPDLAAEIHMLQDIDRLQQTLADLASMLQVGATASTETPVSRHDLGSTVKLESLRQRLGIARGPLPGDFLAPDSDDDDITWL